MEDAIGFAMVDLLDYWVRAPGSLTTDDYERNYWFAVRRAVWMGVQFLAQTTAALLNQDSLDEMAEAGREPIEDFDPDEGLVEDEDWTFAQSIFDKLDDTKAEWLRAHLSGLSTRQIAEEAGVSQPAVVQRQQQVVRQVRAIARAEGHLP